MNVKSEGTEIPQEDDGVQIQVENTDIAPIEEKNQSVMADLDSQPLSDLGVSVMDQEVLEANVAAEVCAQNSRII
jgi:hypothetical protein